MAKKYIDTLKCFLYSSKSQSNNSEYCWGQYYNPDQPNPSAKEYREKCCISCQPGEYLNQGINSCVNCEPGFACESSLRKIFQT